MAGGLEQYRRKRDFRKTGEPRGEEGSSGEGPVFVIQQHSTLRQGGSEHYDFRLEVGGVLVSWAVPKGPSTDPRDRRLGLRVEDHPLEYADFEGTIPEGEYGAGTVLVWDRGAYRNLRQEDRTMEEALQEEQVEVSLEGRKLQGGYALVRTGNRGKGSGGKRGGSGDDEDLWLLVKRDDGAADARPNPVSTEPDSVLSGRSLGGIATEEEEGEGENGGGS